MSWLSRLFSKKPKFEVGDIVKCIDDREHTIKFGQEYKILNRTKTTCCRVWCYDIGLTLDPFHHRYTVCVPCGGKQIQGKDIHWAHESRFAFLRKEKAKAQVEECVSIETKKILTEEIERIGAN